jgi:hypothetical protein
MLTSLFKKTKQGKKKLGEQETFGSKRNFRNVLSHLKFLKVEVILTTVMCSEYFTKQN